VAGFGATVTRFVGLRSWVFARRRGARPGGRHHKELPAEH
jgi:hypothetical protein